MEMKHNFARPRRELTYVREATQMMNHPDEDREIAAWPEGSDQSFAGIYVWRPEDAEDGDGY
jgi:hypothetical protein